MFRRKKIPRSDSLYISFVNKQGKMENEYIPRNTTRLRKWLEKRRQAVYIKLGIDEHYANYRYILSDDIIKQEDILFIIHVLEQHDGKPDYRRERWFYEKLRLLYQEEIDIFIKPLIEYEKKNGVAITHPYGRAYYKRWISKQNSDMKRLYHGVNPIEASEIIDSMMDKLLSILKAQARKQSYYDKKLQKELGKEKEIT